MIILGIESTCDETAAALVEDGRHLLSNVISTSVKEQALYGGVVPEIASRRHCEFISATVKKALLDAGKTIDAVDAVAVTFAPGLIGWKITYKKLYTYIKKKDDMIDEGSVSNISNVKNLLVWYITLSPESSEDEIVNLIMDAYTDQILAIDVYSYDYTKDWKDIADHLEDIPAGFLSYLNLKQSEYNLKKRLMGNVNVTEQYQKAKSAKGSYSQISGRIGIYAIQNKKQTYIPIEWSGYGFMINNVYNN